MNESEEIKTLTCIYGHEWPFEEKEDWNICPICGSKGGTPGSTGTRIYTPV